jgi:PadR family transcriptional regulator PadR
MLVLQTLPSGPQHGNGIATHIQRATDDELLIDHDSLYPALQRLERACLISSDWGTSDNNRAARYYKLTRAVVLGSVLANCVSRGTNNWVNRPR